MKKIILLILTLAVSLSLAACGGGGGTAGTAKTSNPPASTAGTKPTAGSSSTASKGGPVADGKFKSVNDMLKASSDLYDLFAGPINSADEPIDLLFGNGFVAFVGSQVSNDLDDTDGTFGDKNSKNGTYTRQGDKITIATDYTYDKSSMGNQKGDHVVESGAADLAAGSAWYETSTERDGAVISKSRYDYQFKNGALVALEQHSSDIDATGRDYKNNTVKAIVIDKNSYQFAVGTATKGIAQAFLKFDAAKDTAAMKTAMQGAGFKIQYFGNVSGGKLNMQ